MYSSLTQISNELGDHDKSPGHSSYAEGGATTTRDGG